MPHFGLMDEEKMTAEEAVLQRARLHFRGGRRRLREGKLPEAVGTLYDAVQAAMRWYALTNEEVHEQLHVRGETILEDDVRLQELLHEYGAWDDSLDFQKFTLHLDDALERKISSVDEDKLLGQIDAVLTKLGINPFNEDDLPPEDPRTF